MASYSEKTRDISIDIVVLPGFSEGLSKRGAWFAYAEGNKNIFKRFSPGCSHVLRYIVHEPESSVPLSDGEIDHLVNQVTLNLDQFRSQLGRLELFYKDIRKRGKINAFLYILGILTVRWYWWIFLTRGELSFNNQQNARAFRSAENTANVITRYWIRGRNPLFKTVLSEVLEKYSRLEGEPLKKYALLRDFAAEKSKLFKDSKESGSFWAITAGGYREIIKKLTSHSYVTSLLPTNFYQRILYFFLRTFKVPKPESIFSVRNLSMQINISGPEYQIEEDTLPEKETRGLNTAEGNIFELYLMASKCGDPVCVPLQEPYDFTTTLARSEIIRARDLPLEIILHVGTDREMELLTGYQRVGGGQGGVHARLQNAALDTRRQNEALLGYYYRERISTFYKEYRVRYPFRSRLHSLFPWLFITNGIPVASLLAGVWLFMDPYYQGKQLRNYNNYYTRMLEGVDWAYHNVSIRIRCNHALGHINSMIRDKTNPCAFRDVVKEINECALPVSIMDRVLLNNLTTETMQLKDFQREANNFTTIPMNFIGGEGVLPIGEIVNGGLGDI